MEFSIKSLAPGQTKHGCAVVGVYATARDATEAQLEGVAAGSNPA